MAVPRSDTDSMCSIPFTVVVKARSLTVTIRPCISVGDSPEKFQMTVTTGMLMAGKMSTIMVTMDTTPRTAMSRARTTNVYGRRRASRTIHMAVSLHDSGHQAVRSSDGAPAASQSLNCPEAATSLHSVNTSLAMARIAPVEAVSSEKQRSSSQASKCSGSGSESTACSRSRRLSDIPMASGVVSRSRRPRLPSEASRAASSARQASAGRAHVMAPPGHSSTQPKECPQPRRRGDDLHGSSFRGRPAKATVERNDVQDERGEVLQKHVLGADRRQGGDGLDVVPASLADVDTLLPGSLRRQRAEILVTALSAEGTAQPLGSPVAAAASAAKPSLAVESPCLGKCRPAAAA